MGLATTTTHLPITKRLYPKDISKPLIERSAFLGLCSRDTKFGGEGYHVIVRASYNTGRGASFERAYANLRASVLRRFLVFPRSQYALYRLEGKLLATTRGNNTAVVQALKVETDSARENFFNDLSRNVHAAGGGALGQLSTSTTLSSTTAILRNPGDHVNFSEGQPLVFALDDGSGATPSGLLPSGSPVVLTVVSINRTAGTMVLSAALNTVPSITTSAYIFEDGDTYANSITGLAGWHPVTAPTAGDSFFGVDRSVGDVDRQSGFRVTGGGRAKEETLTVLGARAIAIQSKCTTVFVEPTDMGDFVLELGSRVNFDRVQSSAYADIGYEGIKVHTPGGVYEVIGDPYVRKGEFRACNPKRLYFRTTDAELPMSLNEDGLGELVRDNASDSYVGRLGCFGNVTSEDPFHVGIGTW